LSDKLLRTPPETPQNERPAIQNSDACEAGPLSWVRCEFSDQGDVRFIVFVPPVLIPSLGHVELDCREDLAIVRTFDCAGEVREIRLMNVCVRDGDTVKIVQVESKVNA